MTPVPFVRRALSVLAAAMLVATTFAPVDADARAGKGGSFGSRGSRTFDAPPPTATAPGAQQMQRSTTQPGFGNSSPSTAAPRPAARSGGLFGGGLMGGIMGGLLGAGLFGLLSGSGFLGGLGSLAGLIGLLIQVALVVIVVRFALNWFRNRQQGGSSSPSSYPAPAGAGAGGRSPYQPAQPAPASVNADRFDYPGRGSVPPAGGSYGAGQYGGQDSRPPSGEVTIDASDYEAFERMLKDVQDAWSRQDLGTLHRLATPEMSQMFADDLAELSRDGVVNRVSDVRLLQGDLAEAWSENGEDYATVAMRYALIDVTEDARTRQIVDGDPNRPTEATELWTFVRPSVGGEWRLSAVQQSEEQKKGMFGGLFG